MKTVPENTPFWVVEEKIESSPIYWTGHDPGYDDENGFKMPMWTSDIHEAAKFLTVYECWLDSKDIVDGEIVEHMIESGPAVNKTLTSKQMIELFDKVADRLTKKQLWSIFWWCIFFRRKRIRKFFQLLQDGMYVRSAFRKSQNSNS